MKITGIATKFNKIYVDEIPDNAIRVGNNKFRIQYDDLPLFVRSFYKFSFKNAQHNPIEISIRKPNQSQINLINEAQFEYDKHLKSTELYEQAIADEYLKLHDELPVSIQTGQQSIYGIDRVIREQYWMNKVDKSIRDEYSKIRSMKFNPNV